MRGIGVLFSRFLEVDIHVGVVIGMAIVFVSATLPNTLIWKCSSTHARIISSGSRCPFQPALDFARPCLPIPHILKAAFHFPASDSLTPLSGSAECFRRTSAPFTDSHRQAQPGPLFFLTL